MLQVGATGIEEEYAHRPNSEEILNYWMLLIHSESTD
jgi:hypothetical protein